MTSLKKKLIKQAAPYLKKLPKGSYARLCANVKGVVAKARDGHPAAMDAINEEAAKFAPVLSRESFGAQFKQPYDDLRYNPGWNIPAGSLDGVIGARDINSALKGVMPNKQRKAISEQWSLDNTFPADREYFRGLVGNWGDANLDPKRIGYNARGSDALQFFIGRGLNTGQRQIVQNTPLTVKSYNVGDFYSPEDHTITISPNKRWDPTILGHEMGHAIDHIRRRSAKLNNSEAVARSDLNIDAPIGLSRFTDNMRKNTLPVLTNDEWYNYSIMNLLSEINANHRFMKAMHTSLKENPVLDRRFSRYAQRMTLQPFATYIAANEPAAKDVISKLPEQFQSRAKAYMRLYDRYKRNANDWAKNSGKDLTDPNEIILQYAMKSMGDVVKTDPYLYNDLYDYAIQKGLRPNPNAWYNQPVNPNSRPLDFIFKWAPPVDPDIEKLKTTTNKIQKNPYNSNTQSGDNMKAY